MLRTDHPALRERYVTDTPAEESVGISLVQGKSEVILTSSWTSVTADPYGHDFLVVGT